MAGLRHNGTSHLASFEGCVLRACHLLWLFPLSHSQVLARGEDGEGESSPPGCGTGLPLFPDAWASRTAQG